MQKITLLAVGVLFITGLCACDELVSILSDSDEGHIPDEIPVGIVLPLSGKYVESPDDPKLTRHNAPHSDSSSRTIRAR